MWTAGSVIRTRWCPTGTETAGTVPTVTSTMASKRWVCKVCKKLKTPLVLCVLKCQFNGVFFFQNGDYNKPIPAQYMEHLNHGVSGGLPASETTKTLQWVNCQMLLCRKCNNNQSAKIRQLASFIPRDDVCTVVPFHDHGLFTFTLGEVYSLKCIITVFLQENYDEEIEAYKHHLEQTYKLCRPCQTAVEYYIKYQNRQLRTVLLNHQLRRSRESDKGFVKVSLKSKWMGDFFKTKPNFPNFKIVNLHKIYLFWKSFQYGLKSLQKRNKFKLE